MLRFDTTNPADASHGAGERELVQALKSSFDAAGYETSVYAQVPSRENLLVLVEGEGSEPALMVSGHLDVVPAAGRWTYPPFAGLKADGVVWGRGAVDMKGPVAMYLAALARLIADEGPPRRDVRLCFFADEENGSDLGAAAVIRELPAWIHGVGVALGEPGAPIFDYAGFTFAPIQVAEKRGCWCRAVLTAPGGHASYPPHNSLVPRLASTLETLRNFDFGSDASPAARTMLNYIAETVSATGGSSRDEILLEIVRNPPHALAASLGSSLAVTRLQAGEKINSHPCTATLDLDIRLQPHLDPSATLGRLAEALEAADAELIVDYVDPIAESNLDLTYDVLQQVVHSTCPGFTAVPHLSSGASDARFLSDGGVSCFGFPPLDLRSVTTTHLAHAVDERIPISTLFAATEMVRRALRILCW